MHALIYIYIVIIKGCLHLHIGQTCEEFVNIELISRAVIRLAFS